MPELVIKGDLMALNLLNQTKGIRSLTNAGDDRWSF